jgi:16S rRNA (guanine527-N7)-methyltransferase
VTPEREPLPTRVQDTPTLPPAYGRTVDDGLADLGLTLDATARDAIDGHVRLLLAWTEAINLTAIREPMAVATAHVIDSLTARAALSDIADLDFLDLGSGGGFPGIPLAAALPGSRALLVEPIGKKGRFLQAVVDAIGLDRRVTVATSRAESLAHEPEQRGRWPVVTARAVASTADLVELAFPLLERGGRLIAWKRGDLADELRRAHLAVDALGGGAVEVMDGGSTWPPDHRLVIATRHGDVPDAYPRDPAARRRKPW